MIFHPTEMSVGYSLGFFEFFDPLIPTFDPNFRLGTSKYQDLSKGACQLIPKKMVIFDIL